MSADTRTQRGLQSLCGSGFHLDTPRQFRAEIWAYKAVKQAR